jgi:lipid A disaccharide synthetase
MNNQNENTVENKDFVDVNITNKKKRKMFDINKIVSYGAIILSIVAISFFIKIEYFKPINQVFYVDNANIRAMYQSKIQKDILESKIKEETQITTAIVNFDKDLENILNTLTKDYGINIYASKAFYTSDERIDLTPKIIELMEAKGYKF